MQIDLNPFAIAPSIIFHRRITVCRKINGVPGCQLPTVIVPPPSTYSPSYNTTACPGVTALCGSSNVQGISSSPVFHRTHQHLCDYIESSPTLFWFCKSSTDMKFTLICAAHYLDILNPHLYPTTTSFCLRADFQYKSRISEVTDPDLFVCPTV